MTHVVTDKCIRCKYTDCVAVCPVKAFHEGMNMLVINPDVCIDCGVCVPECPIEAILPETALDQVPEWVRHNRHYSALWPVITSPQIPPQDADHWADLEDKMTAFDPRPAPRSSF